MKNKTHFNKIVDMATSINNQLNKLRDKCNKAIEEIQIHADDYDYDDWQYELALLEETLTNLASFDLEDSIPEKHSNNY